MELTGYRKWFTDKSTIGNLSIDNNWECFTLERVWPECSKIPGEVVCIPEGRFQIELKFSPHFQRLMPHLIGVPGRTEILIHYGNEAVNSLGCILVGQSRGTDFIGNSRKAFDVLFGKIQDALTKETVYVTIVNGPILKAVTDAAV